MTETWNTSESNPQVSGSNLVWQGTISSTGGGSSTFNTNEVFLYRNNEIHRLTEDFYQDLNPQISGDNVVWQGQDGNDWEIYLLKGNEFVQLSDNEWSIANDDIHPQISGNNVVWQGWDGSDYEIYLYNGNNVINLSNNSTEDINPQISGNSVIWQGSDGRDYEIYVARLANEIPPAPPVTLPAPPMTPPPAPIGIVLNGSNRRDTLTGDAGNDSLYGFSGSDVLNRHLQKYYRPPHGGFKLL